jgi:hypothetical protein
MWLHLDPDDRLSPTPIIGAAISRRGITEHTGVANRREEAQTGSASLDYMDNYAMFLTW